MLSFHYTFEDLSEIWSQEIATRVGPDSLRRSKKTIGIFYIGHIDQYNAVKLSFSNINIVYNST